MKRFDGLWRSASLLLFAAACSDAAGPPGQPDAGGDGGSLDAMPDAAPDAMPDAAPDAMPDAPPKPVIPSCKALAASCGATATSDCCASPIVPGSAYYRSYDVAADGRSGDLESPATVSELRLDRYEITVGRFRAFVNAGMGTQAQPPSRSNGAHAKLPGSGWNDGWNRELPATTAALTAALKCDAAFQTWTDAPGANETRPINCLSWYEAFAFCIWDGGYLPTEAEWNAAAAGGDQQRAYPWSSPAASLSVDASRASYGDNFGTDCSGDGQRGCAVTDLVRVGSLPAGDGRWGHSDLAGNLWEWTLDRFAEPYLLPCADCAQLSTGNQRVLRGGSFFGDELFLRSAGRDYYLPFNRLLSVGARCARPARATP